MGEGRFFDLPHRLSVRLLEWRLTASGAVVCRKIGPFEHHADPDVDVVIEDEPH